jgi:predicted transglutaminase-like cysteine proteinase
MTNRVALRSLALPFVLLPAMVLSIMVLPIMVCGSGAAFAQHQADASQSTTADVPATFASRFAALNEVAPLPTTESANVTSATAPSTKAETANDERTTEEPWNLVPIVIEPAQRPSAERAEQPSAQPPSSARTSTERTSRAVTTDPAERSNAPAALPEPFGLKVEPITTGDVITKWNGVVADIRADSEVFARCRSDAAHCPAAARKFLAIVAEGRAHDGRARLGVINRAVNMAIQPMSDMAQWGVPDRWSAPLETFTTGHGDCEDYAIAKYVALIQTGFSDDDVRLVIVRDTGTGQDHAVVAARADGKWLVLDNRRLLMVEATDMPLTLPRFALSHDGIRKFAPTPSAAVADASRAPLSVATATPSTLDLQTSPE